MSQQTRTQKSNVKSNQTSKRSNNSLPVTVKSSSEIRTSRDYIMHLQRTIGNRAVGRLYQSGFLQAKLNIGPANDKYEQEADVVADKVVSMNDSQSVSGETVGESSKAQMKQISRTPLVNSITPLQRVAAPEEELKGKFLQRTEKPEEELKGKFIQRETDEDEAQGKFLQRQAAPEEEEAQGKFLQRQVDEEEEAQGKFLQRETAPEEEEAQGKFLQHKCATCEKEEAQAKLQRRPVNPANLCPKCRNNSPMKMMQRTLRHTSTSLGAGTQRLVQRKDIGMTAPVNVESSINSARGGGRPLSTVERSYYEPRFGTSFEGVKIHTDSNAAQLSRLVNARAFTVGRDIFFGGGEYQPNTGEGKRLMAHELTHTVQQGVRVLKNTLTPLGTRMCRHFEGFLITKSPQNVSVLGFAQNAFF